MSSFCRVALSLCLLLGSMLPAAAADVSAEDCLVQAGAGDDCGACAAQAALPKAGPRLTCAPLCAPLAAARRRVPPSTPAPLARALSPPAL